MTTGTGVEAILFVLAMTTTSVMMVLALIVATKKVALGSHALDQNNCARMAMKPLHQLHQHQLHENEEAQ